MTKGSGYGVYSTRGGYGPYKKPIGAILGGIGGLVGGLFGSNRADAEAREALAAGSVSHLRIRGPELRDAPVTVRDLSPARYRTDEGDMIAEIRALRAEVKEIHRVMTGGMPERRIAG